jgi:hypothetical protein
VAIFSADNVEVDSSMLKHCSVLIDPINIDAPPEEDILRFTLATSVSHASSERNGVRNNRSTTEEEEEDFEGAADDDEEEEAHIGDEGENFLPKAPRDEFFTLARKKNRRVAFCGVVVVVVVIAVVVVFIVRRRKKRKTFSSRLKSSFDDGEREV